MSIDIQTAMTETAARLDEAVAAELDRNRAMIIEHGGTDGEADEFVEQRRNELKDWTDHVLLYSAHAFALSTFAPRA